jgi:chemotaxis methyl-accepting protein methylase
LREHTSDSVFRDVRIHATDVDGSFGPQIVDGVFSEQEVKQIPYPIRYRCFQVTEQPGRVQVVDEIRAKMSFSRHDLLSPAPPRDDFHWIVCTNVLSHCDEMERRQVLRMFHGAMRPGGLLALASTSNTLESMETLFEPISRRAPIYRRLDAPESVRRHVDSPHAPAACVPNESWRLSRT